MKTCYNRLTLALACLILVIVPLGFSNDCVAGDTVPTSQPRPLKSLDPHWDAKACGYCHQIEGGTAKSISPEKVDKICLGCHDGTAATAEPHSIGGVLGGDQFTKPQGWPLVDGRLGCLTCHDVKQGCNTSARRSSGTPAFLRGTRQGFCMNCHKAGDYNKYNPHSMLIEDNTYRLGSCRFCHLPKFKSMRLGLCRKCHSGHVDWTDPGHIGREISPDMQAYIAARELTGTTTRPSQELITKLKSSGAEPVRLRTSQDGKIVCTSCHNPHLEGVFPADHRMAYGAMKLTSPDKVTSPVRNRQLCLRCHNK